MRTEYELLHRPLGSYTSQHFSQHATPEEAMHVAGWPDPSSWHLTASGVTALTEYQLTWRGIAPDSLPWMISPVQVPENAAERVELAVGIALECGRYDGDHHKMWVIDQMVRLLAGGRYEALITEWCAGEDGPETYEWDEGIAP